MMTTFILEIKDSNTATEVPIHLDCNWEFVLSQIKAYNKVVCFVDEQVCAAHSQRFDGLNCIIVKSGEAAKDITYVMSLMEQLLVLRVDRKSLLLGIGGGVVTDLVGFVGSTYMRGVAFAFVPTTILAMVDASIGGKNGINIGDYKNMMGTITQPKFLAYDYSFLTSLPRSEWVNGTAEIIKHACIKDAALFNTLQAKNIDELMNNQALLATIIAKNVAIKCDVVANDVHEKGVRKLLNYGHTIAHAIEKSYQLSHGKAVSIGMYYDAVIAQKLGLFNDTNLLDSILKQYELPTQIDVDLLSVIDFMFIDKKVDGATIDYILLSAIGQAEIKNIALEELKIIISNINISK